MRIILDIQGCQSSSRYRGIGRYTLSLATAIARNAGCHEVWFLLNAALSDTPDPLRSDLECIVGGERIVSFTSPGPMAEREPGGSRRARVAELMREHAVAELAPDIVHIGSIFEGCHESVVASIGRLESGIPTAATLYDLIPFLNQDLYLAEPWHRRCYLNKIESLKRADLLLAISRSAGQEAAAALGIPQDRIVEIGAAASERFRPADLAPGIADELLAHYGLVKPFLMHVGAIEPRKNFGGLIKAYAMLPAEVRGAHQLLLVVQGPQQARDELYRLGASVGLVPGEMVLLQAVPDDRLVALYSLCRLFVFPSLHEGFGLPALEAMACGAAVIGSSTTSIPEVIGRTDALFDPDSPAAIAATMHRALTDRPFRLALREHGLAQAKRFTWDASARLALAAFEQMHRDRQRTRSSRVAPLYPRLISAIADPDLNLSRRELKQAAEAIAGNLSSYSRWILEIEPEAYRPGTPERDRTTASHAEPAISVLVVASPLRTSGLAATVASLRAQTTSAWDLVVAAIAGLDESEDSQVRALALRGDGRIRVLSEAAGTRGEALRRALGAAIGTFVMVVECGDVLPERAIETLAGRLREDPEIEILYADEDVLKHGTRTSPQLKPEWSPELLVAYNYFGRPTLVRRSRALEIGSFAPDLGFAAEWDLYLRATQPMMDLVVTRRVRRHPEVLCHRDPGSCDGRPLPEDPRASDFRAALERHWQRQGMAAVEVSTQADGTLHARWEIADPPLVSVIIPNKERADLLSVCLQGLWGSTTYPRIEIVIVDNGSREPATLSLYEEGKAKGVRIVAFEEPFNYSRACNRGARAANGELLLFLNNDIEVVRNDWLEELVRYALLPGVGVVGTKLVYPGGVLQHAGVLVGLHICGLVFREAREYHWDVFGSPSVLRNWMGIMGACQLVRRDVFERIHGFDERYRVANSDVKLCLDAWRSGYRTVYAPAAKLIHHEGASRGYTNPSEDLALTVADIRALGLLEDPYYHPSLSAAHPIPSLRLPGHPSTRENIAADFARLRRSGLAPDILDLWDDSSVAEASGLPRESILWDPDAPGSVVNLWAAARLCIDLLRRRRDLRERFPRALTEGAGGAFARWLKDDAIARFGLPDAARCALDAAFAAEPAARARQIVLYDEAWLSANECCLLPAGRRALVARLFRSVAAGELRREAAWWLLLEAAESPGRELLHTWLFRPRWQEACPDGPTVFGRERLLDWIPGRCAKSGSSLSVGLAPEEVCDSEQIRLGFLAHRHWRSHHPQALHRADAAQALVRWLGSEAGGLPHTQRAWCAQRSAPDIATALTARGVNVLGHFAYPSGLRTSCESVVACLNRAGYDTALRNVPVDLASDEPMHWRLSGLERFDTTIVHVQPEPFFDKAIPRSGLHPRVPAAYRIAFWYWELDTIPEAWDKSAAQCDEIWTATSFVADGLRARYRKPVHAFLPGFELPKLVPLPREHFGLPRDKFMLLCVFHMTSIMERKNPLASISAFHRAFGPQDDAILVIKTSFGEKNPGGLAQLLEAASHPQVFVIDSVSTQQETLSLMAAADAYLSLHRSEGLGLTMAEAMLLGKPVIATGYSGNLDFMNEGNSLLVDHRLIRLERDYPPYSAGARWAEPSVEHAASLMRRVYEHRELAREIGARACSELTGSLSYAACGEAMAERLDAIAAARIPGQSG